MLHVYQTWQGETFGRKEISVKKKGKFETLKDHEINKTHTREH